MAEPSSTALSFFVLTIIIFLIKPSESASAATPLDFIRSSCASTLYPSLCFSSLSPYASDINRSPLKLSQIATSLSLKHLRSVSVHASSLSLMSASSSTNLPRPTVASALKDCAVLLGSAASRIKNSMAELKKLKGAARGRESRWCMSNIQTWLSAALTNEETCMDGLMEAGGTAAPSSSVVVDVSGKIGVAKMYTSVALALVNKLANGVVQQTSNKN